MKTVLALTILAAISHAGEVCHSASYPSTPTNWTRQFVAPKHDPVLGPLRSVTVTMKCTVRGDCGLENVLGGTVETIDASLSAICTLQRPNGSAILGVRPRSESHVTLGPDDGTLDFAGPSGQWLAGLQADIERHVVLRSVSDLALFTETGGDPSIVLDLFVSGASYTTGNTGPLTVSFDTRAAVGVTVCYGYREILQTHSVPSQTLNWTHSRTFAKHDPSLGPLRAVRIRARNALTGEARFENPSPLAIVVDAAIACETWISRPDASTALSVRTSFPFVDPLAAFDGVIDFGGTSGSDHTGIAVESSGATTLNSPADLALFTAGAPDETITLGLFSANVSTTTGGGPLVTQFAAAAGCELEVLYDHAAPVTLYCFGDGSTLSCLCGPSTPGAQQGCPSSIGSGGELRASGFAEIGDDTLVLTATNLPATTTVVLLQGTSPVAQHFGDGLQCVGGSTRRLAVHSASTGIASFPPAGLTISRLGSAGVGATLRYQGWYRDAVSYCAPSSHNLTNGVAIDW